MKNAIVFVKKNKILFVFFVLFFLSAVFIDSFLTERNLINFLIQISTEGIMVCGVVFVILNGDFDISIGSILTLCSLLAVLIINATNSVILALVACIAVGMIIGYINGVLVTRVGIHSFIVTLSAMTLYRGIAFLISDGKSFICKNDVFINLSLGKSLYFPNLVLIFFILLIITEIVLKLTRFGRNMYAAGGNREVAKNSGISVDYYRISAFVISAVSAALAGFLLASRLNTGSPNNGNDAAMNVISAIVLGGTSLSGGRGGALKAFVGLLIIGLLTNALNMMNVFSYYQYAIKGLLVIIIVATDRFFYNKRLNV